MGENSTDNETKRYITMTAKQSSVVFIGRFLGYLLGFLINFIFARYYGPKIFGQYSLIITMLNIIVIFTVFGLNNGIVKYASRFVNSNERNKLMEVIRISFFYSLIFSLVGLILLVFFRKIISVNLFNDSELSIVLLYSSFLIFPLTLTRIFNGIYRAFKDLKDYILSVEVLRRLLMVIVLIGLHLLEVYNITIIILIFLLIEIFNLMYLSKKLSNLDISFSKIFNFKIKNTNLKKELMSYSSMAILIDFMHLILNKIDRIMLGLFNTSSSVGIYSTAATVTALLTFFLTSSNVVFSPIISELYSNDNIVLLERLYSTITKWVIILTLPIMINVYFFSEVIMGFFGEEYIIGSTALIILGFGKFISITVGATGYIMNMCGFEKELLISDFLMAIINIFLNFILIPKFGIVGAAIATGISISIFNLIKLVQVRYHLNISPFNSDYFYIIINFSVITIITFIAQKNYNNIYILFLNTFFAIIISTMISYLFRDELDEFVLNKLRNKLKKLL